jgi:16S rRNA (uracil1498-N3)-methyltransferase
MARRRFFVDEFLGDRAVLHGPGARHLCQVLRVKPGQLYEVSDATRVWLGRVVTAAPSEVVFAIEQELPAGPGLPDVTVLAAIFKFDRYEWMLEKATELGVARLVPVIAARTEAGLARAAAKRVERWRRLVHEAAQQSRRLRPLEVLDPLPLDRALASDWGQPRWILDESLAGFHEGELDAAPAGGERPVLLTGPEGGFTDAERTLAHRHCFAPVSLGPLILRAETAVLAALAVVLYRHTALEPN